MWFGGLPTSTGIGKNTFTISQLGLHKRVFILTFKNLNSKNTPKPYHGGGGGTLEQSDNICLFFSMSFTQYEPHTTIVQSLLQ